MAVRVIKFRAWATQSKKMFYDAGLDSRGVEVYWFDSEIEEETVLGDRQEKSLLQHTILMQYTGLKDKNGKEIYEGDIIREDSPPYHCGEIRYDTGAFYITGIKDGYSELCHILVDDFWEIIGNIHENPELLKEIDNG